MQQVVPRRVRIACSSSALKLKNCSISNRDSRRGNVRRPRKGICQRFMTALLCFFKRA
jgi:hypothetical protein